MFVWIINFLLFAVLTLPLSYADDKKPDGQTPNDEKKSEIHITSDKMVLESNAEYVEFMGNVRATQEESVLTGNSLKVFYQGGLDKNKESFVGEESIKKIVAKGNVKIIFEDKIATAQQATYTTASRILVLSGPDATIISGKDSISGEKITFYRADDRVIVESGKEKRVKAVFFSKQGMLN
jgi:lipopolysaccharide export system protein LptA